MRKLRLTIRDVMANYGYDGDRVLEGCRLKNIWKLESGTVYALSGSNGCGKTSCLHAIAGDIMTTAGHAEIAQEGRGSIVQSINSLGEYIRIFLAPQDTSLCFPSELSLFTMFAGWSAIYAHVPKTWSQIIESARYLDSIAIPPSQTDSDQHISFEELISDKRYFRCKSLSGGQLQWLCILLYEILDVDLLLLDEPFSALSPLQLNSAYSYLREIAMARNRIIVFATHDACVPEGISLISLD
jgi:ABC-type multidrug transport system ATPase subunit